MVHSSLFKNRCREHRNVATTQTLRKSSSSSSSSSSAVIGAGERESERKREKERERERDIEGKSEREGKIRYDRRFSVHRYTYRSHGNSSTLPEWQQVHGEQKIVLHDHYLSF